MLKYSACKINCGFHGKTPAIIGPLRDFIVSHRVIKHNEALYFIQRRRMSQQYIIANWKQYMTYHEATAWLTRHTNEFATLTKNSRTQLIICPSHEVLDGASRLLNNSGVSLGAQVCSPFQSGAHTGYVGAASLYELGVTYSLVGHSERRAFESEETLLAQLKELMTYNITPIICCGETQEAYQRGATLSVLEEQLTPLLALVEARATRMTTVLVAYEPIYAIGTGVIPTQEHLEKVFTWLHQKYALQGAIRLVFVYGGSITSKTAEGLRTVPYLNGFLVGKASTDFQELKNIVS